jgi:hypothetical protein
VRVSLPELILCTEEKSEYMQIYGMDVAKYQNTYMAHPKLNDKHMYNRIIE